MKSNNDMENSVQIQENQKVNYMTPFLTMVFLFLIVGFLTTANGQFQGPLQNALLSDMGNLKNTFATLITFSWFLAYPVFGGVGAKWVNKFGYRGTLIRGLGVMIIGLALTLSCSSFATYFPEANITMGDYSVPGAFFLFLLGSFVTGGSATILQVVINPYLTACTVKNTFNKMKHKFENMDTVNNESGNSLVKRFVRKIIVAGDDITYVCNAYIAFDTVRYFCEEISKLAMNGKNSEKDIQEYGFSVCAGIAYVNSHFPFGIAYEVAENCCNSAKDAAKKNENKAYYKNYKITSEKEYDRKDKSCFEKTGNFVDFQICKNIQCRDLEKMREKEFITPAGELLMQRPYYVPMPFEKDGLNRINSTKVNNFDKLVDNIKYFANESNIPRSLAKDIRNTYYMGSNQINLFGSFLDSRNWKMPGGLPCKDNMYVDCNGTKTAAWYDAIEIMDYCMNVYIEDKEVAENED